jgi:signal transduction histidine kinase
MHTDREGIAAADAAGFDLAGFMRALAHEIANPLNALTMNSELMRLQLDRGDARRAREVLDRLLADCARCARVTRELQKFGGALGAQPPAPVALRELLDRAVVGLSLEYGGTIPHFSVAAADADVVADRAAIERAIIALLRNAAEAGAANVALSAHADHNEIVIDVRDDGPGMPAADQPRAADAFFTTRRADGGVGLGLTLAREMLRRHGGSVTLQPNTPRGMHVQLRLPRSSSGL